MAETLDARHEHSAKTENARLTTGRTYQVLGRVFASHETVDHDAREYVRGDLSTNVCENYFSQLKRSIDGTHHHVSNTHLPRYLAEFEFGTRRASCRTAFAWSA